MRQLLTTWARDVFTLRPIRRRRLRPCDFLQFAAAEVLEIRTMLSVSLGPLIVNDMPAGKDELVALPVTNSTANPISFTATSSNPNVTATIVTGGRSLKLNVSGVDSNNVAFNGDLVFRLFESEAPVTTARIIQLANSGFYNGLIFHRIISGFVAQGGDPTGTGSGGSGTKFSDEFNRDLTFTSNGLLAMANSGDDTNDSQFFITAVDRSLAQLPQNLNFEHSVFGILTSGVDTFRKLMSTPTNGANRPATNEVINSATVFTDTQNGVVRLHTAAGFTGSTTLTVIANDGNGSTNQNQASLNVVADTVNDRPFLGPVSNQVTNQGIPVTFTVQGIDLLNDPLTFVVKDPASFTANGGTATDPANVSVSIQVTPASGSTPATATITLTPQGTFSGTVNMIVGVRDGTNRGASLESSSNFDTQQITLTVNPVNHAPSTPGGSTSTALNQPVSIQFTGNSGDPDKTQTLTFEIVSQPQHGTLSNFNAATGALTYAPAGNFAGTDSFTYRVHDNGGTANGGQDTSALATFAISVAAPTLTGLALAPASDDGVFNDDRVILNSTPTFIVSGPAGSVVTFLVNGTSQVVATETSPGQFSGTLTRQMLQVGANSISATGALNGLTSTPTAPLTFAYAPSDASVYTVPGAFGSAQKATFHWDSRNAAFWNEIGVFAVDDAAGHVNGIAPGAAGYSAAALNSASRRILFAQGQTAGATTTLDVTGGELLAFYLVANNTTSTLLKYNPQNLVTGLNVFFSVQAANPDHFNHFRNTADTQTGQQVMVWEDLLFGGDRDFNDAVISLTPQATASATVGDALRIPGGPVHNVPVTFTLDPTQRSPGSPDAAPPAKAQGEIGVVVVSDNAGTISGLAPGSAGYLAAALASSTRQVLYSMGDPLNTQKTLQIPGGSLVAYYYTPSSTAAGVLANNPNNDPKVGPVAFFSFAAANPDHADHFRWFGPEFAPLPGTAANGPSPLLLHLVGKLNPSPNDFDDYLIAISFPQ